MMGRQEAAQAPLFYAFNLDAHIPANHLLRGIDRFLDLSELHQHLTAHYSNTGRPSVDPAWLIRMLVVGYCFGIRSERQLCKEAADQAFLKTHAAQSTSCGRFAHFSYRHCGRCVPCLIRRAAFNAWGKTDKTVYVYSDLSKDDSDHARYDDVRSAAVAVAEAKAEGFDRWIRPRLTLSYVGDPAPYREVVRRGLTEVGKFLNASGVK